ncbi:hypothetical protein [Gordonia iterans]
MLYVLLAGGFYLSLGLTADRMLASRPRAARLVSRVSGVAMVVVGASLVVERFVIAH